MTAPLVSVVMAAYNHELFVAEAIDSVLSQDGVNFEFLIGDDGSSDRTREVIAGYSDRRINFSPYKINCGACTVINELIGRAKGKYVAIINSDDVWVENKLKRQLDLLESRPDIAASFGRVRFIDRNSQPIDKNSIHFGRAYDQDNRSSSKWLRYFFDKANCLCHPTVLIRHQCYKEVGLYDNRLRQLPDFDMWIRIVKKYNIHISEYELIKFRIIHGENASSQITKNAIRTMNEHYLISNDFFDGVTRNQLIDGFGDLLHCKDIPTCEHLDIEKMLLYFNANRWLGKPYQLIGLLKLNQLLRSPAHQELLQDTYGIDDTWFHAKMGKVDVLRPNLNSVVRSSGYILRDLLRKARFPLRAL